MLHGAAAANSKMPANRFNALCARFLNIQEASPVGVTRYRIHFDDLARQRARDVNRSVGAVGYPVAPMAKAIDQNSLNHTRPR